MRFLNIAFLVLLVFEVMSIFWMADWIGGGWTFLLMIISIAAGIFFLRRLGLSAVFLAVAAARSGGKMSAYQMMWPLRYTFACLLLMSPGFVSSVVALILMLPFKGGSKVNMQTGQWFGQSFEQNFGQRFRYHRSSASSDDDIIEGEFTVDGKNQAKQDDTKHLPKS